MRVCSSKLSDWLRTCNSNVLFEIVSSKDDFSEQKDLFSPMSSDVMLNNFCSSADFSDKICKQQRTGRQSFGSSAKCQVPTVDTHVSFWARGTHALGYLCAYIEYSSACLHGLVPIFSIQFSGRCAFRPTPPNLAPPRDPRPLLHPGLGLL